MGVCLSEFPPQKRVLFNCPDVLPNHRVFGLCGLIAVPAALCIAGCGGGETDAMKKRVSALQDEVTLLQNSQDRLEERLAAVEMGAQEAAERPPKAESASGTFERPRLKVIKVQPGGDSQAPETGPAASRSAWRRTEGRVPDPRIGRLPGQAARLSR